MLEEELNKIGLYKEPKRPHIFTDREDVEFNIKSRELFAFDCTDGDLEFIRKIKDLEDLKQALYDSFPNCRNSFNLD